MHTMHCTQTKITKRFIKKKNENQTQSCLSPLPNSPENSISLKVPYLKRVLKKLHLSLRWQTIYRYIGQRILHLFIWDQTVAAEVTKKTQTAEHRLCAQSHEQILLSSMVRY